MGKETDIVGFLDAFDLSSEDSNEILIGGWFQRGGSC
jgi:hypothetical protein